MVGVCAKERTMIHESLCMCQVIFNKSIYESYHGLVETVDCHLQASFW